MFRGKQTLITPAGLSLDSTGEASLTLSGKAESLHLADRVTVVLGCYQHPLVRVCTW
jgi:hypothetical protein